MFALITETTSSIERFSYEEAQISPLQTETNFREVPSLVWHFYHTESEPRQNRAMTKREKKPHIKTAMRFPPEVHAELQEAAERAGHSMNDEILQRVMAGRGGATLRDLLAQGAVTQQMVQQIIDAISATRR